MRALALRLLKVAAGLAITGTAIAVEPQSGWWWNPSEPGRGYFIESTGGSVYAASYLYSDSGAPAWYVTGVAGSTGAGFAGALGTYSGGQTLTGGYRVPDGPTSSGSARFVFSDATHGTLTWPGGAIPIQRYEINPAKASLGLPKNPFHPETGWWWNEAEGGRGFSIEIQGDSIFIAGFLYDASGAPVWYVSGGTMESPSVFRGQWMEYQNGQSLTGPFRMASVKNPNVGDMAIGFTSQTAATLYLPDGRAIPLTRFRYLAPVKAPLELDVPQTGVISAPFAVERYSVSLTAGVSYLFELEGESTGQGTLGDPVLRLLDRNGKQLAYSDDISTPSQPNSRIEFSPSLTGTYYLSAQGLGVLTGSYRISMKRGG